MATKIRLQRGGRKSYAFYRIVIADARAPRDLISSVHSIGSSVVHSQPTLFVTSLAARASI